MGSGNGGGGNPEGCLEAEAWDLYQDSLAQGIQLYAHQMDWIFESTENYQFAMEALDALQNGGEVDWDYQVILDPEFVNNECLYSVYEDMGKASTFNNYLQNFDGDMSVANLMLSADDNFSNTYTTYTNAMAITNPPLVSNLIKIDFNTDPSTSGNILDKPDIFKVVAFIHELIHAEMYRKMLDALMEADINQTTLNWTNWSHSQFQTYIESLQNKYFGIFDFYTRYDFDISTPNNAQHQQMAAYYRDAIKEVLGDYDPSLTEQQKDALSWIGLNGANVVSWQNLSPAEQQSINNIIQNIKNTFPNGCN